MHLAVGPLKLQLGLLSIPLNEPQPIFLLKLTQAIDVPVFLQLADPNPRRFRVRQIRCGVGVDVEGLLPGGFPVFL